MTIVYQGLLDFLRKWLLNNLIGMNMGLTVKRDGAQRQQLRTKQSSFPKFD